MNDELTLWFHARVAALETAMNELLNYHGVRDLYEQDEEFSAMVADIEKLLEETA